MVRLSPLLSLPRYAKHVSVSKWWSGIPKHRTSVSLGSLGMAVYKAAQAVRSRSSKKVLRPRTSIPRQFPNYFESTESHCKKARHLASQENSQPYPNATGAKLKYGEAGMDRKDRFWSLRDAHRHSSDACLLHRRKDGTSKVLNGLFAVAIATQSATLADWRVASVLWCNHVTHLEIPACTLEEALVFFQYIQSGARRRSANHAAKQRLWRSSQTRPDQRTRRGARRAEHSCWGPGACAFGGSRQSSGPLQISRLDARFRSFFIRVRLSRQFLRELQNWLALCGGEGRELDSQEL